MAILKRSETLDEEARQEETDIQPGDVNVKKSASFTAKQNDGTVEKTSYLDSEALNKMNREKSQDNLSPLELAQQEACSPGFCGTIWIQKLIKGEITKDDIPKVRRQPKGS